MISDELIELFELACTKNVGFQFYSKNVMDDYIHFDKNRKIVYANIGDSENVKHMKEISVKIEKIMKELEDF